MSFHKSHFDMPSKRQKGLLTNAEKRWLLKMFRDMQTSDLIPYSYQKKLDDMYPRIVNSIITRNWSK